MAQVLVHRIPAYIAGAQGIRVEVDGVTFPAKMTLRKPDLDLALDPGEQVFVFHLSFGRSRPLVVDIKRNPVGILVWANPENSPKLLLKKNRDLTVFARIADIGEIREARKAGRQVTGKPFGATFAMLGLWALVLVAMQFQLSRSGVAVPFVFAILTSIVCAVQWVQWSSRSGAQQRVRRVDCRSD